MFCVAVLPVSAHRFSQRSSTTTMDHNAATALDISANYLDTSQGIRNESAKRWCVSSVDVMCWNGSITSLCMFDAYGRMSEIMCG